MSRIGKLDLLKQLFDTVWIPDAVRQEVFGAGPGLPGAKEVEFADWIHHKPSQNNFAVNLLRDRLDAGESEAIILAMETDADLLLIDEARGRRVAESKGVATIGCLGCLVLAKQKALLKQVTPLMDQLIISGFRMDALLYDEVKALAGES